MAGMMRDEFKRAFHGRTLAYHPTFSDDGRPVVVQLGRAGRSQVGHALLVALINQLARAHRRIVIVGDLTGGLLCADLFGHRSLESATVGLARAINPFIEVTASNRVPSDALITLGIATPDADIGVGAQGWCAVLGRQASLDDRPGTIWGALYAACLAAATAFHRQRGDTADPSGRYSLWMLGSDEEGPDFGGPLDLGSVLQVGAGAVGAALDYFLGLIGLAGKWRIVDGDVVDVTNLQRQLLFVAADAGYPDGVPALKATRAAQLLGPVATGSPLYYDADAIAQRERFDLILALANGGNVRRVLQARQPTVLLHATTGRSWEAFLHRHIAGRDDCISCRLDESAGQFVCAEGEVATSTSRFDAALPFLSAAAGLMLAAGLARLQLGTLAEGQKNLWKLNLAEPEPLVSSMVCSCRTECRLRFDAVTRMEFDKYSRFAGLDGSLRPQIERADRSDL